MVPASAEYGVRARMKAIFPLGRDKDAIRKAPTMLQSITAMHPLMRTLGLESRPPYPKGRLLEQGEWSLSDAVRCRPKI